MLINFNKILHTGGIGKHVYSQIFDLFHVGELTVLVDEEDQSKGNRHMYDTTERRSHFWEHHGIFVQVVVKAMCAERNNFAFYLKKHVLVMIEWELKFSGLTGNKERAIERQKIATRIVIALFVGRSNPHLWNRYGKWACSLCYTFRKQSLAAPFLVISDISDKTADYGHLCKRAVVKELHNKSITQLISTCRESLGRFLIVKQICKVEFGHGKGNLAPEVLPEEESPAKRKAHPSAERMNHSIRKAQFVAMVTVQLEKFRGSVTEHGLGEPADESAVEGNNVSTYDQKLCSSTKADEWIAQVLMKNPISTVDKYFTLDINVFSSLRKRVKLVERVWETEQTSLSTEFKYIFPQNSQGAALGGHPQVAGGDPSGGAVEGTTDNDSDGEMLCDEDI